MQVVNSVIKGTEALWERKQMNVNQYMYQYSEDGKKNREVLKS